MVLMELIILSWCIRSMFSSSTTCVRLVLVNAMLNDYCIIIIIIQVVIVNRCTDKSWFAVRSFLTRLSEGNAPSTNAFFFTRNVRAMAIRGVVAGRADIRLGVAQTKDARHQLVRLAIGVGVAPSFPRWWWRPTFHSDANVGSGAVRILLTGGSQLDRRGRALTRDAIQVEEFVQFAQRIQRIAVVSHILGRGGRGGQEEEEEP